MAGAKRVLTVLSTLLFVGAFNAGPVLASTAFTAVCGFNVSYSISGANVRSDAYTDTSVQAQNIYVHSEFYRDGVYLAGPRDDEVNRSHAEAWSGWNFSWGFEHPTYRVKSWHDIRVNNVWQTEKFCDFSWTKP